MTAASDKKKAQDEIALKEAVEAMSDSDRKIAKKLDEIITKNAPGLIRRTWYGMPAYTNGDKIICFFRSRQKFGERFMTLGFNDSAKLDDGNMWPIYYAITDLSSTEEAKIVELIKKAVS